MTQPHNPIDRPTEPPRSDSPTDDAADDAAPTVPAEVTHYEHTNPDPTFGPPVAPGDLGQLAHYRVRKLLGKGGMGAVYLAIDQGLQRKVALKVMLPRAAADPAARSRFLREARAAAAVKHDNVVTIYQVGEDRGTPYIAMEYLSGNSLEEYLRRKGQLNLPQVLRVGREAAAGLVAAHALGLIHRDIKPANLWLEAPNGRVKILDFGLVKATGGRSADLTGSGTVVGTPQFMAPEQARGEAVDHRADLFGLGAVLYRLTTGRLPFAGPTVIAVLTALAVDDPPPVLSLNPAAPPTLADLIHRMLAKGPEDRPQSAEEVLAALRSIRRGAGDPFPEGGGTGPQMYAPIPVTAVESNAFAGLADDPPPVREAASSARRTSPAVVWACIGVAVVAAIVLGYVGFILFPSPPPQAPRPRTPLPDPAAIKAPPKPPRPADPDRAVAEWVLSQGANAAVTVNGAEVQDPAQLPAGPLRLTQVTIRTGVNVRDDDLDRFRFLDSLEFLSLGEGSDISDKGLDRLSAFPFAAGLTGLGLRCPGATEAGLAYLPRFHNLRLLHLWGPSRPTAAGLAHLGKLPELNNLTIAHATLPAAALAPLRETKLSGLSLLHCTLPDDGLADLHNLPALRDLSLGSTSIGDAGAAHLAGLTGLRSLSLSGSRMTDTGLAAVGRIAALEALDLQNVPIADAGVRHLSGLAKLTSLRLDGSRITDDSMPVLASLPSLATVYLTGTAITDVGLARLTPHKFVCLHIGGTRVTAEGVAKLKAALPDCQVHSDFGPPK